jgi:DNA processing protein
VVSGLALGIDAAAHRGCLDAGGRGVAVLAGGPDIPSPRRNRRLYERMHEHGAVLSETPPGRRAFRWSFPARNRIMAALGRMTVVVEAADPSGSLITAEFAQDLGRPVGAVPGRVTSRMAEGTNNLLRDGATVISRAEDVLDELFGAGSGAIRLRQPASSADAELDLTPAERAVLAAVEAGETVDGIARSAALGASDVRAALARLESSGHVVRCGLGSYARAAGR